ncbi:MAG: Ig-like domain-containing protein [Muribaculaceae bacterium]|nr:Ig-like domain-containing protein [Muribaculaceae bacterium]
MKTSMFFAATLLAAAGFSTHAATPAPEVVIPNPGGNLIINNISDNGLWGVSEKHLDGVESPVGGVLINLNTLEKVDITSPTTFCGVNDVTDDGKIIVGQYNSKPAYWQPDGATWTLMPIPEGFDMGCLNAITPDGKYSVGYLGTSADPYKAYPVMYDMTTSTQIDLPNVPVYDMQHIDQDQNIFLNLSPDGRYLLGYMSMSYVLPPQLCIYVYDRSDDSVDFIGFTPDLAKPWTPDVPGTFFVEGPSMSPNGQWVTGIAYMVQQVPGSDWPAESRHPFRYNVADKSFEILTQNEAADVGSFAVGNDGFLYMATPAEYPYPTAVFQQGKFIVSLDQVYKQIYNLDFEEATGIPVTGRPLHTSADGKTVIMMPTLDTTYILRFGEETLQDAVNKVKLLADYTVYPTPGAQMSKLNTITITFEREVQVKGNSSKITFKSEDGSNSWSPVSSNGVVVDGRKVTLTFRSRDLEAGKKYTLNIPEGMIVLKDDNSITADEINVDFNGRANTPVAMVSSVPEDNGAVAFLDLSANPITILFDADLKLSENQTGFLYIDGTELPITTMSILANGKQMFVFPPVRQNLIEGETYTVVVPANAVTDISGGGANEEIVLHYTGTYVPELNADDKYLFNEDCGTMDNFLFYDGDHLTPDPLVEGWGFNKDTPWYYVTDENSTDMAFGSHSMYNGGGKSDDWMMTRQIHIPDNKCYLEFDAQSYLWATDDYLKIYVWEADEVYNVLNANTVDRIREEGKVVFNEKLTPGSDEDVLEGDWTKYTVRLPEYAGKNIYIAFVNEMEDQSAIFIDNIRVVHDMAFMTKIDTPQRVVNLDEVTIKGTVAVASDLDNYDSISMTLLDGEGIEVSKIEESGLNLTNEKPYSFSFPKALPLKKATTNKYTISVTLGENTATAVSEVRNLVFQPSRKIVLEEYTGQTCPNCPQGILAIENIQKLYPGALIPVAIHTYTGDNLGTGLENYSAFLSLNAAPSGRIDRGVIAMAMKSTASGNYVFSGVGDVDPVTGLEPELWLDLFRTQMASATDVDLTVKSTLDEANNCINVKTSVRPALNLERSAYNIFAVIIENKIMGYQQNNLYSIKDPVLGEWGAGGKYAAPVVVPYEVNEVARTTWGTTYNGTAGLIPSKLVAGETYEANIQIPLSSNISNKENCEVVIMLIDAGSERVVNANVCELNGESTNYNGVDEIIAGGEGQIGMTVAGDLLMVNGENFKVEAYDIAGLPVVKASGSGLHAYSLNGFKGILIVKAADAQGNATTQKFLVK